MAIVLTLGLLFVSLLVASLFQWASLTAIYHYSCQVFFEADSDYGRLLTATGFSHIPSTLYAGIVLVAHVLLSRIGINIINPVMFIVTIMVYCLNIALSIIGLKVLSEISIGKSAICVIPPNILLIVVQILFIF